MERKENFVQGKEDGTNENFVQGEEEGIGENFVQGEEEDKSENCEFVTSYFAWISLDEQKEKAHILENITK